MRLTFFYKSADGTESLFTPDRLVDICEMEKTVVNNTKIQDEQPVD